MKTLLATLLLTSAVTVRGAIAAAQTPSPVKTAVPVHHYMLPPTPKAKMAKKPMAKATPQSKM